MKSKDLVTLVVVSLFSVLIGFVLSSILIKSPPLSRPVETMGGINKDFPDAQEGVYEEVFPAEVIDTFSEFRAGPDANAN